MQPITIEGVQIFPEVTAIQNVYMHSEPEANAPEENIKIDDHVLWGNYPPKIVESPLKMEEMFENKRVLLTPLVPEFVIVHDGLPTDTTAANYYVEFTDYIKNVASSEVYSTWSRETIKANVYAILSFTMNRIYTEWYRSRGYQFTITSSTQYDQKFIYGRNIFNTISDVVDEVFAEYIRKPNVTQPFFAQYNDGIKVNNPGWLSQWGSKDLGDRGFQALDILKNYYGNTISIKQAEIISGSPNSFPGYNLQLNSCGEAVQKLQNELNAISGSYPAIPKIPNADGKYVETTKKAVEVFQNIFNLPITGITDFATWYRISNVFIGVSKMLQGTYA